MTHELTHFEKFCHYFEILRYYFEILSHYFEKVSHCNDLQEGFFPPHLRKWAYIEAHCIHKRKKVDTFVVIMTYYHIINCMT